MATLKDIAFSRVAGESDSPISINLDLADIAGLDLARLALEYQTFLASEIGADARIEFSSSNDTLAVARGGVVIELVAADGDGAALLAELEGLGLEHGGAFKNAVSGLFPIANLEKLPNVANLAFASASYVLPRVGAVDSQGDASMFTDNVRNLWGVDGSGVTVGILSDSFDTANAFGNASTSYADDIATGDLPAGVNILLDYNQSDASDEGRGMAQLIHDVAPGASLEFASAFFGPAAFAQSIRDLAVNSDVIVDDIGYLTQPFFQDGVIAQAVNTVFAGGDAYFSAAGNSARSSYESDFRETATSNLFGVTGQWHDFDPGAGVDLAQNFTLQPGQSVLFSLQWDDPYLSGAPSSGGALTDIDAALFDVNTSAVIAVGATNNIGGDPFEFFSYTNNTGAVQAVALGITNFGGPTAGVIKYIDFGTGVTAGAEYATLSGTSFGHPSAEGGLGVGAADYRDTPEFGTVPPLLEDFSSFGDTPVYFDAAGNRLVTPEFRQRVDITAPDGTDTTFFGFDAEPNGFPNFFGTSAAAPHAAALAALMLEGDGTLTPTEIYDAMRFSAIDITSTQGGVVTSAGYDNGSGFGLIDGPGSFAMAGIAATSPLVVDTLTDEFDTDYSAGDLSLREAIDIASGTGQEVQFDPTLAGGIIRLDAGLGTLDITTGTFTINGNANGDAAGIPDITISGDTGGDDVTDVNAFGNAVTDVAANSAGGTDTDNIQLFGVTGGSTDVTFESLTLTGGNAGGDGGGIFVDTAASLSLNRMTVEGNHSGASGGGLHVLDGNLTITNSTIANNTATGYGGGVFSDTDLSTYTTTITSSTISGNAAGLGGGGIDNFEGLAVISNSTIVDNDAPSAAGLNSYFDSLTRTEIVSTIVAENTGSDDVGGRGAGSNSFDSGGNNLIGADSAGLFTDGVNGDQVGTTGAPIDPVLGPLVDNGGASATHLPDTLSPVINAGSNPLSLTTDQIGNPRVQDTGIDIGAVERTVLPDLIAPSFTISDTNPFLGETVTVDWTIENLGPGSSGMFDTGFYLSTDANVTTDDIFVEFRDTLNVGPPGSSQIQTADIAIDGFIAPGSYYIAAIADDFSQVAEGNESNNASTPILIDISAPPVSVDNGTGTPGGFATIQSAMNAALSNATITVIPTNYSANPESVIVFHENVLFDLAAGITPTLTLASGFFDVTVQGAGDATIIGNTGTNALIGGDGNDTLIGLAGPDLLDGGGGVNTADYAASPGRVVVDIALAIGLDGDADGDGLFNIHRVVGSGFDDLLLGSIDPNTLIGEQGEDTLSGFGGEDVLAGGLGNDQISGGNENDTISGDQDNDLLFGNGGDDQILGSVGLDTVFGGAGNDDVIGGGDDDDLSGQGGADTLAGNSGADTLRGGSGDDSLIGGNDNDLLLGNGNNDTLEGGGGNDTLQGAAGSDVLIGGSGDDVLTGSIGGDRLDGGSGNDTMNGGGTDGARDIYHFALGYDLDRINAFDQAGTDVIELDQDLWIATNPGLSEQDVIDLFGTLDLSGTILTLDFGGTDILEIQNGVGIVQSTLGGDVVFV